jgi:hypothetical protein
MTEDNHSRRNTARRPRVRGNPVARSPLLRKGGAHQRSTGAERQRQRLSLDDAIEEWLETRDEASSEERETGGSGSPFFCGLSF